MQPSLAINGRRGLFWHIVIAHHDQKPPATEFTTFSNRHDVTRCGMDNLDIYVWIGNTYRLGLALK